MNKIAKTEKTKNIKLNTIQAFCITCEKKHQIQSTLAKDFKIDTCSKCHPFYLGTQKFESKAGRMERFRSLVRKTAELQKKRPSKIKATPLAPKATTTSLIKTPIKENKNV
ncbi:MAG: 50S ribosomal protein L31 [Mollicutes bacterium]|nr:MAG: 50S ribosomal protein L31 [Mollicutes bacterium]